MTTASDTFHSRTGALMAHDGVARALDALEFLDPPLDRDSWVKLLMAAHDAGISADAARAWSERGPNYDDHSFRDAWRSITPGGGITSKTLFRAAIDAGWRAPAERPRLTREQKAAYDAEHARRREQEAKAKAEREDTAAVRAKAIWDAGVPASIHSYLTRKACKAHKDVRMGNWEYTDPSDGEIYQIPNCLLIPMFDRQKKIHSLQCIEADESRSKRYLKGGRKKGCFFPIGKPLEIDGRRVFVIGEGYATCASVHEDTGHMVLVCFDASNLLDVAHSVRERDPNAIILFAADNDLWNRKPDGAPYNPGIDAATKAAKVVSGIVAIPPFKPSDAWGEDENGNPTGPKDFNDLHGVKGAGSVAEVISAALAIAHQTRIMLAPTHDEALGVAYAHECLAVLHTYLALKEDTTAIDLQQPLFVSYDGDIQRAAELAALFPGAALTILAAPGDEVEAQRVANQYGGVTVDKSLSGESWRGWGEYFIGQLFDRIDSVANEDHASLEATARVLEQAQSAPVVHDELRKFSGEASMSLSDEAVEMAEQALEQAATDRDIASPLDASAPALKDRTGLIAEVGIIPLGSHGGDLVFWRRDFKRVVILAPKALGSHQGLQCLAPTQNWEAWWRENFKPQFASNVLINWSAGLGDVDISRVPATDAKPEEVREAFLRAKAAASGTSPAPVVLAELLALSPEWRGVVFFDEFASRATYSLSPPCGGSAGALTDGHDDMLAAYLTSKYGLSISSKAAHDTVNLLAAQNPRHPLREYLKSLTWDGVPRLDTWLVDYAGAKDGVFVRAASAKTLIAAVERAFVPGSKVDTALVLEGAQGVKKSTLLRALAPDTSWFAEDLAGTIGGKDALQGLHGKWMIELSEIAAIKKGTVEDVKAFLTRRVDSYRSPYGRRVADHPRQCIFVGSVNPSADGSWLHDPTGGRRFWPVQVTKADVARLAQVRDQLWAEAAHRHQAGEQHWLDESEEEIATMEQKARLQENPWDFAVAKFLEARAFNGEPIATAEIFEFSQNRKPASKDSRELTGIAEALRARGWIMKPHGPARTNRWFSGSPI